MERTTGGTCFHLSCFTLGNEMFMWMSKGCVKKTVSSTNDRDLTCRPLSWTSLQSWLCLDILLNVKVNYQDIVMFCLLLDRISHSCPCTQSPTSPNIQWLEKFLGSYVWKFVVRQVINLLVPKIYCKLPMFGTAFSFFLECSRIVDLHWLHLLSMPMYTNPQISQLLQNYLWTCRTLRWRLNLQICCCTYWFTQFTCL